MSSGEEATSRYASSSTPLNSTLTRCCFPYLLPLLFPHASPRVTCPPYDIVLLFSFKSASLTLSPKVTTSNPRPRRPDHFPHSCPELHRRIPDSTNHRARPLVANPPSLTPLRRDNLNSSAVCLTCSLDSETLPRLLPNVLICSAFATFHRLRNAIEASRPNRTD